MKTTHCSQYFSWKYYLKRHWSGSPTLFPCRLKCGLQRVCTQATHTHLLFHVSDSKMPHMANESWTRPCEFPCGQCLPFLLLGSLTQWDPQHPCHFSEPIWILVILSQLMTLHITSSPLLTRQALSPTQPVTGAVGRRSSESDLGGTCLHQLSDCRRGTTWQSLACKMEQHSIGGTVVWTENLTEGPI